MRSRNAPADAGLSHDERRPKHVPSRVGASPCRPARIGARTRTRTDTSHRNHVGSSAPWGGPPAGDCRRRAVAQSEAGAGSSARVRVRPSPGRSVPGARAECPEPFILREPHGASFGGELPCGLVFPAPGNPQVRINRAAPIGVLVQQFCQRPIRHLDGLAATRSARFREWHSAWFTQTRARLPSASAAGVVRGGFAGRGRDRAI